MSARKVRVITRTQIDAMIDAAVRDALARQKQGMAQQERERELDAARAQLNALQRERDQEKSRRLGAEQTEDNLRAKIRDLEQTLRLRGEILQEETRKAFEEGRREAQEIITGLQMEAEQARAGLEEATSRVEATPDPEEIVAKMKETIAQEIAAKFEEARHRRETQAVKEKDVVLDSLFKESLETNDAQMDIRTSTSQSISGALNKLKGFHNGRDELETRGEETP